MFDLSINLALRALYREDTPDASTNLIVSREASPWIV